MDKNYLASKTYMRVTSWDLYQWSLRAEDWTAWIKVLNKWSCLLDQVECPPPLGHVLRCSDVHFAHPEAGYDASINIGPGLVCDYDYSQTSCCCWSPFWGCSGPPWRQDGVSIATTCSPLSPPSEAQPPPPWTETRWGRRRWDRA